MSASGSSGCAGAYFERLRPLLHEQRFGETTTQELWDGLFLECRADRFGGQGEIYQEPWFRAACEEILRRLKEPKSAAVLNRYRPMRDPRKLKLLDPACGSMHFGLSRLRRVLADLPRGLGLGSGRLAQRCLSLRGYVG